MPRVITASEPSWIGPFTGLSPRQFAKLVTSLRRDGADAIRKGRPWGLPLEDRALLIVVYWRTNLTMRQLAQLFGVSKSAADRIINHLGPTLALQPRKRFRKETVLIVDGTLVPTRTTRWPSNRRTTGTPPTIRSSSMPTPGSSSWSAALARQPKRLQGMGGIRCQGHRRHHHDDRRRGYPGTGLVMPHRRRKGEGLPDWKQAHNKSHKQVRARVEHVFARMKTWKILRDCRLRGDGVHHAMSGIARLHNLTLAG